MPEWEDEQEEAVDPEGPDESDIDDAETDPCPYCKKPVYEDTVRCPYCGAYINLEDEPPSPKQTWFLIAVIAAIVVVVLLGVSAFGRLVMPWFFALAGHITTVGT